MKPLEKLTKAQILSFCFMSFCSGVMIGVGGTAFLLANALFGEWGRLIGSILFSLGILAIVMFDMKLFTGLISDIPEMGAKNLWKLPICFLGNMLCNFHHISPLRTKTNLYNYITIFAKCQLLRGISETIRQINVFVCFGK